MAAPPPPHPAPPRRSRLGWTDAALALAAALLAALALAHGFDRWGGRDWDEFQADLICARRALLEEGEPALWTPYRAGGHDAWADPQSLWASPLGLLSLLCGVSWGPRLFCALCALATALGVAWLGGLLGLGRAGRACAALLASWGTPLGLYAAAGVPTFTLGLALLPWLCGCVLVGSRRSMAAGGALLALDLYGGDINHFLFHSLFLVFVGGGSALARRSPRRALGLVGLFLCAATLSAPKLVPSFLLSQRIPRPGSMKGRGAMTLGLLGHAFLDRDAVRFVEAPYHEFVVLTHDGRLAHGVPLAEARPETAVDWVYVGSYVGPLGAALAAAGLLLLLRGGRRRDFLVLVVAAGVFLWLSFGPNLRPSGWRVLHALPVFSSLRSPERLVLYPFLAVVLLAGVGLDRVARVARTRGWVVVSLALPLLALDVAPPTWRAYRQSFVEPPRFGLERLPPRVPFTQTWVERPSDSSYYGPPVAAFAARGIGVVNGYSGVPVVPRALPRQHPGYRGEAFLRGAERALRARFGTRRVEVEDLPADALPDVLVVNQNYAPGWRVDEPAGLSARRGADGRIEVPLPRGTRRVVLRYTSPGLWLGCAVFLLGLLAFAVAACGLRLAAKRAPSLAGG
ncbi:MAG: hypothetical protein D6731_25410 [Planctomycetota bacterium]|nr:MAG: hypothetical protein D6731_25410 [Planctomycetota bacterium]